MKIIEATPYQFWLQQQGATRVPGIVFAPRSLLPDEHGDIGHRHYDAVNGTRSSARGRDPRFAVEAKSP